jgi:FSR family fosmidomycin resistance protein-like MFS transporter
VPQPFFGVIADRRDAGWMAGAGAGLAGLGLIAAAHGPRGALLALLALPPLALPCGTLLRDPG